MFPKKQALCEIIFGQMRIPVSDKERGKQAIEGIFMIGESAKAEARPRGRRRGGRKAKLAKVTVKGRRGGTGPKRGGRPRRAAQVERETDAAFSGKSIRDLRKKLGLSQSKLGSLVGASLSAVMAWEKGKYSPRQDKVIQLSDLAKKGKEGVEKLIPKKEAKGVREKTAERKGARRGKRPGVAKEKGKKAGIGRRIKKFLRQKGKTEKPVEMAEKAVANSEEVTKDLK